MSYAFPNQSGTYHQGLTKREYFAAHAPNPPSHWHGGSNDFTSFIEWRWYYADKMIEASYKK